MIRAAPGAIPFYPSYTPPSPQPQETQYVLDYNDPLGINSVVDLLFNEAALNKNY